jgi:hypothetical protein
MRSRPKRRRPTVDPETLGAWPGVTVRHILVVANRTLSEEALLRELESRSAADPVSVMILAPATKAEDTSTHFALAAGATDLTPWAGHAESGAARQARLSDQAYKDAEYRLGRALSRLRVSGVSADGEVGPADPLSGIEELIARHSFDEVIVSTMPHAVSRWLKADLPHRIERRFHLPVHVITAKHT